MKVLNYKKGDIIHKTGEIADTLELVITGKVELKSNDYSVSCKKGSVIGILERAASPYSYDYIALEDTTVSVYPFTRFSDVNRLVEENFSTCDVLVTASAGLVISLSSKYRQLKRYSDKFYQDLNKYYMKYKELCGIYHIEVQSFPFLENTEEFTPEKEMPDWVNDYYDQLEIMPRDAKQSFFGTHPSLTTASIWEASSHAQLFMSLCGQVSTYSQELIDRYFYSSGSDLLDLYYNLLTKNRQKQISTTFASDVSDCVNELLDEFDSNPLVPSQKLEEKKELFASIIQSESQSDNSEEEDELDNSKYQLVENSLDTILGYTSLDDAEIDLFKSLISKYKIAQDKNATSNEMIQLRQDISKSFFNIYEAAILSSFDMAKVPIILKMFFCFGYIDESLVGKDNAVKLYELASDLEKYTSQNIYTIYDWLKAIYKGEVEPSKNEFDLDFVSYIKQQRAGGYITAQMEERYLKSNTEKLRFEIQNFFKIGMKITSGRPSVFCPLLSSHNVIKSLESIFVTAKKIEDNWNAIKNIDYGCFFRPCTYQAPEYHIARELILMEVMPKVILMPLIGSKALLWQETSGVRRDTPGRIAMPVFTEADLLLMQTKLAAEFRWEICKRIQGARWNDVSDHSLTSDYFDYLQFYRKNSDLSADAKEKIKMQITNSKNSFKNVFITDYIQWIKYESAGSPRLNKVAKSILFTYCPFSKEHREKLSANPMYSELVTRHEAKAAKQLKTLAIRYNKIKGDSSDLPNEIKAYLQYYWL